MRDTAINIDKLWLCIIILSQIISACNSNNNDTEHTNTIPTLEPYHTTTLSGAFDINSIIREGTFEFNKQNFKISDDNPNNISTILARPYDANSIGFKFLIKSNDSTVKIQIDSVPLSGEPYNVTINTIVKGDIVLYNGTDTITSNATPIEIYGHLERLNFRPKSRELAPFLFDCDLNINTMIGQDSLKLKIISIYELE